ncbi:hypothetical protein V1638_05590 [Pseudarthrobacter sp. J64]|uniref:hypothetical protein n=1 Tax=Pseudarthrobacter sp. J64 TaxID=3116485 RepID=UPI002E81C950|nr:hypothetical protein [Pseudarthrobacter sp. J64]MEE2568868.1 hypothetical protein [Pseudarthrobacter sp. J64]
MNIRIPVLNVRPGNRSPGLPGSVRNQPGLAQEVDPVLGGAGHVEPPARPGPGIRKAGRRKAGIRKAGPRKANGGNTDPALPVLGAPTLPPAVVRFVPDRMLRR